MPKKKAQYRKYNYYTNEDRVCISAFVHPELARGLGEISRDERKTISWVIELALADYFGVEILLKKTKRTLPAYVEQRNVQTIGTTARLLSFERGRRRGRGM